jgi:hypothetical protein
MQMLGAGAPTAGLPRFITDLFNLLQSSPTYTGGPLTATDYEGNIVTSPAGVPAFEGGRLATTVAEGATLGPELVVNGGFDSDTVWSKTNATISAGQAHLTASTTLSQSGTPSPVSGKRYQLTYTITAISTGSSNIKGYVGSAGAGTARTTIGTFTEEIVAAGAMTIYFFTGGGFISGSIDNVSLREVIPTWYDTEIDGTPIQPSVSIPTRSGTKKWYQEPFASPFGYSNWPARTNLFLNSNTPVTQNITTTAQQYTISVLGTGDVTVSGTATGTATEGSPLTVTATAGTLTCTVTGTLSRVQVEAGAFTSPWIETAATTVTRAATNLTLPTAGVLPVNDFGIWGDVIPGASGQVDGYVMGTHIDGSNFGGVYGRTGTGAITLRKTLAGAHQLTDSGYVPLANTPFQYQVFQSRVYGMGIRVKQQGGAWSAWTLKNDADGRLDAPIAATYQVGTKDSAAYYAGYYPSLAITQHADPKAELERLTLKYGA